MPKGVEHHITSETTISTATRATRRRPRRSDPLGDPAAVRALLAELRAQLPALIPTHERELKRLLCAVRHVESHPASDTRRGRPSQFDRADLLQIGGVLRALLERATRGRLSLRSFVDHYLRMLDFPADVAEALTEGKVNLFEAAQLARLTPAALDLTPAAAKAKRAALLKAHLSVQASGPRLRQRVTELLAAAAAPESRASSSDLAAALEADLLDLDPAHLFYDQLRQIGLALNDVRADELDEELLEEILAAGDQLLNVLARARRRQQARSKLTI